MIYRHWSTIARIVGAPLPTDPFQEITMRLPEWFEDATCSETDGDSFFPDRGTAVHTTAAKKVCRGCPVRQKCLEYALIHDERHGVWGGLSPRERRALRKKASA